MAEIIGWEVLLVFGFVVPLLFFAWVGIVQLGREKQWGWIIALEK